ncbi:succinate dehydrogenase, hydrophobic membrane anchor protein [Loktanella sp. SALINAS62]|uniref:succinate dehydrogenase, hydrophobic membrane anchor protein n=1 Tax=Loktanella sp. SALINAS62 TaxID=2706124 RepID=UPI001B8B60FA|nr:succinate dehydrogenase, hydrophobic membrane anchor protein [Loktanella sp. SALINAS62]MBS1301352.1 succinate dehydrogenase, hydrophobic membrane anchor protein [Loktanella sp. SALINAS62]
MAFMTDRKRATGNGSARSGTQHHWQMQVTSVALLLLIPCFVFTFGAIYGAPYEQVVAYYQRPFPSVIAALTIAISFLHFRGGVQTLIEDYIHGALKAPLIIAMICISYAAAAVGVFAVVRLAL